LVDAYHVPKPLSQQLLPFGRSGDELGELTFGVEQFLVLSMRRGQSACPWRTVRGLRVLRVFVVFLLVFVFDSFCFRVLVGRGFGQSAAEARTVRGQADSPRPPRGQSVFLGVATGGSVGFFGQSAAQAGQSAGFGRTVRVALVDRPPLLAGQSASAWQLCSLVRFLPPFFRASAYASRNRA
jgi:hypothetical protein